MRRARIGLLVMASVFLPSVALAQLSVCGVSPAEVQPFGGSGADVTSISEPAQTQIELSPGVETYLQFQVSAALTDVRIEATDDSGVDPVMVLLDTSGNELASDDDGGGGRAARIETSLDAGSYCVKVYNFSSNSGASTVQLSRWEQAAITPGADAGSGAAEACTASTPADPVAFGPINAAVANGGEISFSRTAPVTYHRLTVDKPLGLTITANGTEADPVVRVYDDAGNVMFENDDYDGLNAQIDMQTPLQPGDYCIAVSALSDATQPIDVVVKAFDEQAFMNARYATGEASPPIGGSYPIDDIGVIQSSYSADVLVGKDARWLMFEVTEPSLVLIQGIGNGGADSQLYLYNDRGQQLGFNDDSGMGGNATRDSQIAAELYPGRYLAAVLLYNADPAGPSEPVRVSFQRYVRAK